MATINGITNSSSNEASNLKLGVLGVNIDIRNEILNRNIGKYQLYTETLDPAIGVVYDPYDYEGNLPESKDNGGILNDTYNVDTRKLAQSLAALYGNRTKTDIENMLMYRSTDVTPAFMKRWFGVYGDFQDYTEYTENMSVGTAKQIITSYTQVVKDALSNTGTLLGSSVLATATNIANKIDSVLSYVSLDYVLDKYENSVGVVRDLQMAAALGDGITTNLNGGSSDTMLGQLSSKYYSNTLYSAAQYASYRRGKFSSTKYITDSYEGKYGNTLATINTGEGLPALITGSIQWLKTINRIKEIDSATYITAFTQSDTIELLASKIGVTAKEIAPTYYGKYSNTNHYVGSGKRERLVIAPLGSGITKTYEWVPDNKSYTSKDTLFANIVGKTSIINGTYYQYNDADKDGDIGKGSFTKDTSSNISRPFYSDFEVFKIENSNDLLARTNKLFANNAIGTLIGRFKTGKNDNTASLTQTAVHNVYGLSHGRNLLKKNPNSANGYENPYCRVWTYHHQYSNLQDRIRPFVNTDGQPIGAGELQKNWHQFRNPHISVKTRLGVLSSLGKNGMVNITPTRGKNQNKIQTKNCMFSIENLAWRDIAKEQKGKFYVRGVEETNVLATGFPVQDNTLSPEQIGPNGGRIMWFPPYDIEFSETATASWTTNEFIGRGEPVLTYNNSRRHGTLSFTIVIDHPAILDYWKSPSKYGVDIDKSEDTLLRFFAGCEQIEPSDMDVLDDSSTYDNHGEREDQEGLVGHDIMVYEFWPNNFSGDNFKGVSEDVLAKLDDYANHANEHKAAFAFKSNDKDLEDKKYGVQMNYSDTYRYLFGGNLLYLNEDALAFSKTTSGTNSNSTSNTDAEENQATENTIKDILNKEYENEVEAGTSSMNPQEDSSVGKALLEDENGLFVYYEKSSNFGTNNVQNQEIASTIGAASTNISDGITIESCNRYDESDSGETSSDSKSKSDAETLSELLSTDIFDDVDNYYDISLGYEMCSNSISTYLTNYKESEVNWYNPTLYPSGNWFFGGGSPIISGKKKGTPTETGTGEKATVTPTETGTGEKATVTQKKRIWDGNEGSAKKTTGSASETKTANENDFMYTVWYEPSPTKVDIEYGHPEEIKEIEPDIAYSSYYDVNKEKDSIKVAIKKDGFNPVTLMASQVEVTSLFDDYVKTFKSMTIPGSTDNSGTKISNYNYINNVSAYLNSTTSDTKYLFVPFYHPTTITRVNKLKYRLDDMLIGMACYDHANGRFYVGGYDESIMVLYHNEIGKKKLEAEGNGAAKTCRIFWENALFSYFETFYNLSDWNDSASIYNFTRNVYDTQTEVGQQYIQKFNGYINNVIRGEGGPMYCTSDKTPTDIKARIEDLPFADCRMGYVSYLVRNSGDNYGKVDFLALKQDSNFLDSKFLPFVMPGDIFDYQQLEENNAKNKNTDKFPRWKSTVSDGVSNGQTLFDLSFAFIAQPWREIKNGKFCFLQAPYVVLKQKLDTAYSEDNLNMRKKIFNNPSAYNVVLTKDGRKYSMDDENAKAALLYQIETQNATWEEGESSSSSDNSDDSQTSEVKGDVLSDDGDQPAEEKTEAASTKVVNYGTYENFPSLLHDFYYDIPDVSGAANNVNEINKKILSVETKLSAYDHDSKEYKDAVIEQKNLKSQLVTAKNAQEAVKKANRELAERLGKPKAIKNNICVENGLHLVKVNFKEWENHIQDFNSVDEIIKYLDSWGYSEMEGLDFKLLTKFLQASATTDGDTIMGQQSEPLLFLNQCGKYYTGRSKYSDLPEGIMDYMNDFYDTFYDAKFDVPSWTGILTESFRSEKNKASDEENIYIYRIDIPSDKDKYKRCRRFFRKIGACLEALGDKHLYTLLFNVDKVIPEGDSQEIINPNAGGTHWSGQTYCTYVVDESTGKVILKDITPEEYAKIFVDASGEEGKKWQRTSTLIGEFFKQHIKSNEKAYKKIVKINKGDSDYVKNLKDQLNNLVFTYAQAKDFYETLSETSESDCDDSIEQYISDKEGDKRYFMILKQVSGTLYRIKTKSDVFIEGNKYESQSYNYNLIRDENTGVLSVAETAYDPDCALIKPLFDRKELLCGTHSFSSEEAFNKSGFKLGSYPVDDIKIKITGAASGSTKEKGINGMAYTLKGSQGTKTWYYWNYNIGSGYTGNLAKIQNKVVKIFRKIQNEIEDDVCSIRNYFFKTEDLKTQYGYDVGDYWETVATNVSKFNDGSAAGRNKIPTVSAIRGNDVLEREKTVFHDLEIFNGIFTVEKEGKLGDYSDFSFSGSDVNDSLLFIKKCGTPVSGNTELNYKSEDDNDGCFQLFLALPCLQQTAFEASGITKMRSVLLKLEKAFSDDYENDKNELYSGLTESAELIRRWYNARDIDITSVSGTSFVESGLCVSYNDFFSSIFFADYIINGKTEFNEPNITGKWKGKVPKQNLKYICDIDKDVSTLLRYNNILGFGMVPLVSNDFLDGEFNSSQPNSRARLFITTSECPSGGFYYYELGKDGDIGEKHFCTNDKVFVDIAGASYNGAIITKFEKNTIFARYTDQKENTYLVFLYHLKRMKGSDISEDDCIYNHLGSDMTFSDVDDNYKIDTVADRRLYYSRIIKPFRASLSNIIRKWNRMFSKHGIEKLLEYKKELEENIEILNSYKFTKSNTQVLNKNAVEYEELVDYIISEAKDNTFEYQNFTECSLSNLKNGDYFILTSGGTSTSGNTSNQFVKIEDLTDGYKYTDESQLYKRFAGVEGGYIPLKEAKESGEYTDDSFEDALYVLFENSKVDSRTSYILGFVGNGFIVKNSPWEIYDALRQGKNGKIARRMYEQSVEENTHYRINGDDGIKKENGGFGALGVFIVNMPEDSCGIYGSLGEFALYCDVDGGYNDAGYSDGKINSSPNGYYYLMDPENVQKDVDKLKEVEESVEGEITYYEDDNETLEGLEGFGADNLENLDDYKTQRRGSGENDAAMASNPDLELEGVYKRGIIIKQEKGKAPEYKGTCSAYNIVYKGREGGVKIDKRFLKPFPEVKGSYSLSAYGPKDGKSDSQKSAYQYASDFCEYIDFRNYADLHSIGLNSCKEIVNAIIDYKFGEGHFYHATHSFAEFYLAALKAKNKSTIDKITNEDKYLAHCQRSVLRSIHGNVKSYDIVYGKDKQMSMNPETDTNGKFEETINTIILESHKRVVELAKKLSDRMSGNKIAQFWYAGAASENGISAHNATLSEHRALNMANTFFETIGCKHDALIQEDGILDKPQYTMFKQGGVDGNDNCLVQKFYRHSVIGIDFDEKREGGTQFSSTLSTKKKENQKNAYHRYDYERRFFELLPYNAPLAYKRLVEKIRYFNPAFHAITPEGFNARLTFLHQCTRQGPTVSASDSKNTDDYSASNLSFGRPPFCVLRIGDFINTKIAINSINISYPDIQWDLNPEGIGVQPMLAKISMDIEILGGSSLEGPISKLQNAVSFNYYANTEIYDDRSDFYDVPDSTLKDGGKKAESDFRHWDPVMESSSGEAKNEKK